MTLCFFLAGLSILFLAFWLYGFPQRHANAMAEARARSVTELGVAAAVKPVLNVKNSLYILSRLPEMRDFKAGGFLVPALKTRCDDLQLFVESLELPVANAWSVLLDFERSAAYWQEIPDALLRLFWKITTFQLTQSENDIEDFNFVAGSATADDKLRILASAQLVPFTLQLLSTGIDHFKFSFNSVAAFIDRLPGFCSARQSMSNPVESLFALMLDEGLLRAIALKNLEGEIIVEVGDTAVKNVDPDSRDCRAIVSGAPFFSGSIFYDQSGHRPVWRVAVPVRDENRNPVACLTALVDISFLSQLAGLMTSGPDRLIFLERSGVAIGHHDELLVAQQVNLGRSLPLLTQVSEKPVFQVVHRNGRTLLLTAASIKLSGFRHLPDWIVCSQMDLTSVTALENYIILICVILLAATGVYVLSCCVVRIMKSSREEI